MKRTRHRHPFIREHLAHMRKLIARYGHAVQGVSPSFDAPGWVYTIGLHAFAHPELILIGGLSIPDQHGVIEELAQRMRAGESFEPGDRVADVIVGYELTFVEVVDTRTEDFAVANRLQSDYRALQVVWPDHENRFPWEPGYALPPEDQRLLGLPPE